MSNLEIFDRLWRGGKRKRDEPTGEEEVEGRRVAKQPRKKVEVEVDKHSVDSEVEMSDMEAVVHQSTKESKPAKSKECMTR